MIASDIQLLSENKDGLMQLGLEMLLNAAMAK